MFPSTKLKKTLAGVFFFLISAGGPLAAQHFPVLRGQRFFGTADNDHAAALVVGPDSSLYAAGWSVDSTGASKGLIYRLPPDLTKPRWTLQPGGSGANRIHALALVPDGSALLFAGATGSQLPQPDAGDPAYASDVWLGKVGVEGRLLLEKRAGGSGPDRANAVAASSFGGFVFAGGSWSNDRDLRPDAPPLSNAWFGMSSRAGELLKQHVWGGSGHEWTTALRPLRDGGFILSGVTTSPELDSSRLRVHGDAWLRKLDLTGKQEWQRVVKKPLDDVINAVTENEYGMIYAAGATGQEGASRQFWLQKYDSSGRQLWERIWGNEGWEELTGVATTSDGGVIACGFSSYRHINHPYLKGRRDLWVIRFDSNGKTLWQQTYGGPQDEEAVAVVEFRPGRYYVLGRKVNDFARDKPSAGLDFWLLCIDEVPCKAADISFVSDLRGTTVKVGAPVKFVNQSKHGDQWLWEFGDGEKSAEKSPVKKFASAGTYIVKLTAIINEKCRSVYVYPQPVVVVE